MKIAIDKVYKFYRLMTWMEMAMSYFDTKHSGNRFSRSTAKAVMPTPARAGALSYLIFALAVGFTAAVVFGLLV